MTKPLNVGLIGYGFMGRTHSNAYRKAPNFFDLPYQPVLKTVCGLEEDQAKAFAHVARIGETLDEIFRLAETRGVPTAEAADELAEARFRRRSEDSTVAA